MQTFEEGMHISTFMEVDQDEDRRAAVADVGSNCMLDMMLVHNLIHSDLHPGNILVRWCLPDCWLMSTAVKVLQMFPVDTEEVCARKKNIALHFKLHPRVHYCLFPHCMCHRFVIDLSCYYREIYHATTEQ
jgi:predicted unusual protein kinase regulating ubiquinone biosynthesis (AarF/ABC1/UbiB family)